MSDTAFGSRNVYGMLFETGARGWGYLSGNASTTSVDSVTTGQVDEAGGEVAYLWFMVIYYGREKGIQM